MAQIYTRMEFAGQKPPIHGAISSRDLKRFVDIFDRRYTQIVFARQEAGVLHNSFEWGRDIYDCVKKQDMENLQHLLFDEKEFHYGVVNPDALRNAKDLAIVLVTAVVQFALSDNLIDVEAAYSASDACIQLLEETMKREDVLPIAYACLYKLTDFIARAKQTPYHPLVARAKAYVYTHLHKPFCVKDIASALGVSPEYLSRTFKSAERITVGQYIRNEKIEKAKHILRFEDDSIAAVSRYLGFSSQSHFAELFHKATGFTPLEYRKKFAANEYSTLSDLVDL